MEIRIISDSKRNYLRQCLEKERGDENVSDEKEEEDTDDEDDTDDEENINHKENTDDEENNDHEEDIDNEENTDDKEQKNILILHEDQLSALVESAIECVYVHPVTLQLVWQTLCLDKFESEIKDTDTEQESERENARQKILTAIPLIQWSTVIFAKHRTLTLSSIFTGNDDTRGGGCGNLNLPVEDFIWTVQNDSGITLQNIVECVYRLKGSKYDWWYELFGGVIINKHKSGNLNGFVSFGYGS
jgi:hypothetical protein